jgi:hypothetical protein
MLYEQRKDIEHLRLDWPDLPADTQLHSIQVELTVAELESHLSPLAGSYSAVPAMYQALLTAALD